jgi:hypothetical protein
MVSVGSRFIIISSCHIRTIVRILIKKLQQLGKNSQRIGVEFRLARAPLHLGRNYNPAQQLPTDRNIAGPWALLVNVSALLRFQRCLEAETDRLEEPDKTTFSLRDPRTEGHFIPPLDLSLYFIYYSLSKLLQLRCCS